MPVLKSEYSCPICKQAGKLSQIAASDSALICLTDGTHRWNDTESFIVLKPQMDFKVALTKFAPQENYEPMSLSVPIGLKAALEAKFGDKAIPTVASILLQLIEGEVMIIGETDLQRLGDAQRLGKRPANSGELIGQIFALKQEVSDSKMIADQAGRDLKAYEGVSIGRVVVDLGPQYETAVAKARDAELPLTMFVTNSIRMVLENGWL